MREPTTPDPPRDPTIDPGTPHPPTATAAGAAREELSRLLAVPHAGNQPGDAVGPYTLLSLLGEGGFGFVWLAERRKPMVQRVALKIIKPGMDTRAVISRFEQERQALAVMDHPNVARVYDAGATDSGRPYFVMEHVAGEPITTYCDRHNLALRQRLELFIPVCEAVQHAHHKGIIHRDIKPSNILVAVRDDKPLPKVIDFGVAKAVSHTMTEATIFTETGQLIGTPEYMSPEQAEMGATDVDTRTDVYSLGVVLYELLAGMLPLDVRSVRAAGYDAIRRLLREHEAPKPSTRLSSVDAATGEAIARRRVIEREALARELRRELDWIPLKALRKDRTQRYGSPADLARDVRRYLDGAPLEAGPESAAYRVRKFVRRHRGAVLATTAVLVALLAGLIGTLSMAAIARDQATIARNAEREQKRLADAEREARRVADAKTAEAEHAARTIEHNSYVANVQMAHAAMEFRQFDRLRQRLDACPEHLRGWEWRWLDACADSSLLVMNGHTSGVNAASFSPDGSRIVTASYDNTARVWDAATGATVAELKGHTNWVTSASFSPDGSRIVTASRDNTARVWDAATGATLAELKGHMERVYSASFSPDGSRIVTASGDNTARVWDAATGATVAELKGHSREVNSASFSPDGSRIVTASDDNTARVWEAIPYRERYAVVSEFRAALTRLTPRIGAAITSGVPLADIRRQIRTDAALSDVERNAALSLVQKADDKERATVLEHVIAAGRLNNAAWIAVRFAGATPEAVSRALVDARRAVELSPHKGNILNTLGVALYRAGEYEEALEVLHQSDAVNSLTIERQPADIAFIAMCWQRLGQRDEACAALGVLRGMVEGPFSDNVEACAWLQEAEALIAGNDAEPP